MVKASGRRPLEVLDDRLAERFRVFRHGALVLLVDGPASAAIAHARATFDAASAAMIGPHVTLTPPFTEDPSSAELDRLRAIASAILPVALAIGGADRFPGSDVVYLRVEPAAPLVRLHAAFLATGLFAVQPWAGGAFVPHVTISEFGANPGGAELTASSIPLIEVVADALAWVAPADGRVFVARVVLAG